MIRLLRWLALPWEEKWSEPVDDWWLTRFERRLDRVVAWSARTILEALGRDDGDDDRGAPVRRY